MTDFVDQVLQKNQCLALFCFPLHLVVNQPEKVLFQCKAATHQKWDVAAFCPITTSNAKCFFALSTLTNTTVVNHHLTKKPAQEKLWTIV